MKEFLFWLHVCLVVGYLSLGLFFSFWIVAIVVLAHRLHYKIFDGCILSKLQKKVKGLAEDRFFLQEAVWRFLRVEISPRTANVIDYSIAVCTLLISLAVSYGGFFAILGLK